MESWDMTQTSPALKFEASPTGSFLSVPGEPYPSLFDSHPTVAPEDVMTPESFSEDYPADARSVAGLTPIPEETATPSPAGDKKPTKKRRSWGQVLPEPKTCLPPRKRAKTEDEREQRRVERVLRNRRAAQSSRERKRLEVEALEQRNKQLEDALRQSQQTSMRLFEELQKMQRNNGVATPLRTTGMTFSQELFSSQGSQSIKAEPMSDSLEELLAAVPVSNTTVNPASLSPDLGPVDEDEPVAASADATAPVKTSPDATQHPAAMLCEDLQCRSAEVSPEWMASQQPLSPALAMFLQLQLLLTSASSLISICQRPLMQIAMSMKAGFSLPPTQPILNAIIWLVTTPSPSASTPRSTSTTLSPTNSALAPPSSSTSSRPARARWPARHSSTSLRLRSLRKILTCSPNLARPLSDATMAALRLVSSEGHDVDRVSEGFDQLAAAAPDVQVSQGQHGGTARALPSKELLLTLLWAIKVEERRAHIRNEVAAKHGRQSVLTRATDQTIVLKVLHKRRREVTDDGAMKRRQSGWS